MKIEKTRVRNLQIFAFPDREIFLNYIADKQQILIAVNAEKILKEETELQRIINENIGYTDGIGAVMALKQKGLQAVKIPGSEFWLDIVQRFYRKKSFYLLGSTQHVIEKTVEKLKLQFPGIDIVAYRDGFLDAQALAEVKCLLSEKKPDIIFVAQGSPRQEYLMDELNKLHPALYMGLGGSFDIYSELKKRAPKLFLDLHLEWLYRLLKEPTRFQRQLALIRFMMLLTLKKL